MRATCIAIRPETPRTYSLYLQANEPFRYQAGQFIALHIPHEHPDDRGTQRWFSLSSAPHEDLLRITFAYDPNHASTFKHALMAMQPGDTCMVDAAMGDFVLPKDTQSTLIFVAAGLGITPIRSMLAAVQAKQQSRTIHLQYGVSTEDDLAFMNELDGYVLASSSIAVSRPRTTAYTPSKLDPQTITALATPQQKPYIYIAGPEAFVESHVRSILTLGYNPSRVLGDYFLGYK